MFPYQTTKVTLELRELIENGTNPFDFEYDGFYVGKDKERFEKKVIDHYYFNQIGQETVGRFLHMFRSRINEIMPYYKQMYNSVLLMEKEENPFESYWLEETYTRETSDSGSSSSNDDTSLTANTSTSSNSGNTTTSSGESENTKNEDLTRIFSDTPQGSINNLTTHMSEGEKNNNSFTENNKNSQELSSQSSGSGTGKTETTQKITNTRTNQTSGNESHTLIRRGNIGVQSLGDEINKIRNSYINIDMMIINDLSDLFLKIY